MVIFHDAFRKGSKLYRLLLICMTFVLFVSCVAYVDNATPKADVTHTNAIDAIIEAYVDHQVVAIGDVHGLVEVREFIIALVNTPAFYENVKTIVIETGNALYQELVDDYVNGADIGMDELQKVWQDLTVSGIGPTDDMSNAELFEAVRTINQGLAENERLRIWLGDPPIDWAMIHTTEDFEPWLIARDSHYADVVIKRVYEPGVKGLLISGASHLTRSAKIDDDMASKGKPTMLDTLEEKYLGSVFLVQIHTGFGMMNAELEPKIAGMPVPSMLSLKGTWLGALPNNMSSMGNATFGTGDTSLGADAKIGTPKVVGESTEPTIKKQKTTFTLAAKEDYVDGYLYLGAVSTLTTFTPSSELYLDDAYFDELNRRYMIVKGQPLTREALLEAQKTP